METREEDGGGVIVSESSSPFDSLPEDCISNIISFTTPRDACVVASVSKIFDSAVKSDFVCDKFLPPEYESLFPKSRDFSSKRELYFDLCDKHVLFDDAKKSFWLDKASGKMCILLSAMDMSIIWGDDPQYWQWIQIPESRFEKVAELLHARWFEIHGKMSTRFLSPRTRYLAYIVFKKRDNFDGFEGVTIEAGVGMVGQKVYRRLICFEESWGCKRGKRRRRNRLMEAKEREDGWLELELGTFLNEGGLVNSVRDTKTLDWKQGLVIQGIEFRPSIF